MLLALSGYKEVGKGTVASYIKSKLGNVLITKFADPVKHSLSIVYSVPRDYWEYDKETPQKELNGKTKRYVMQTYAQGVRDLLGEDIWINSLNLWYINLQDIAINDQLVVIDDLRYPNELHYIQSNEGKVIYIHKDIELSDRHKSESYYSLIRSKADYVLDNNGSLKDLYKQVDFILKDLFN